jgi:hypothetical protein
VPGFLDDYEPVEKRLRFFWDENPEGRIVTSLIKYEEQQYIFEAKVWRKSAMGDLEYPDATGWSSEIVTDRGVNSTSALENCETSAIGRALANLGYAPKGKRPSREEMSKTTPPSPGPSPSSSEGIPLPARCQHEEWELVPGRDDAERCKGCGIGRRRKT